MNLVDTHCHLDLIEERGLSRNEVLQQAAKYNLSAIVQIATDLPSSRYNQELHHSLTDLQDIPQVYWTAGLHPCSAFEEMDASLADIFTLIRENYKRSDFIGIGETGLDYFHNDDAGNKEKQKQSLEAHLQLAKELNLPIILHIRDERSYNPDKTNAIQDVLEIVKAKHPVRGVLHCFSYTDKEAMDFVELGWFVSYSGVLTFPNAKSLQAGAVKLPLDCLLVETDAPFLTPVPHRGQINQPAYAYHTLEALANLRAKQCGEPPQVVKQAIYENSQRFLALKQQ